jgi:serine protease AprX
MKLNVATFVILCGLVLSSTAAAKSPKSAPDLPASTSNGGPIDVIVQFASTVSDETYGRIARRGGQLKQAFPGVGSAVFSVPAAVADEIADDADVLYVSPDRPVEALLDVTNATVGAPLARGSGWDGTGVGIAIIDSGVQDAKDRICCKIRQLPFGRVVG